MPTQTSTASALPLVSPRFNMYRPIHKALRVFMADTLCAVGRLDTRDRALTAAVLAQVQELATACENHMKKEDEFVHAAMELAAPGSSLSSAEEHFHHKYACRRLSALADAVGQADDDEKEARASQLYYYLALFMAENLAHMNLEETENNWALWSAYTDEELMAIERRIVASLSEAERGLTMRWMLPALTPAERLAMVSGMAGQMPAAAFQGMLKTIQTLLTPADWHKLIVGLSDGMRSAA